MSQTNQTTPSLADALSPANIANPYPLYRQMREIDPVYWDERINSWVLTTYAHNVSALRDTRFSSEGFMAETAWIPEELRATLERGPRFASVRDVQEEDAAADAHFAKGFAITRDA